MTKWTSINTEKVCDYYACKANTHFAFKAFQKENPFFILFIIFISTCVCFGWSLRNFEMLYWESIENPSQDWNYPLNAFWCIFVSMCTVGFGDYFAKTHPGRFITIMACLIGLYFTSMLMVFMTQKSALDENEKWAYGLISRLKLRNEIKEQRACMIHMYLKMISVKFKKRKQEISEKDFFIKYGFEQRNMIRKIEVIKNKHKLINTFGQVSFKEKLLNITERISSDIREITEETESIKFISEIIICFSDCQIDMIRDIKKNCHSIRLLYDIIEKSSGKKLFHKLHNFDKTFKDTFEPQISQDERDVQDVKDVKDLKDLDSNASDASDDSDNKFKDFDYENYEENIFDQQFDLEEIVKIYDELQSINKRQKLNKPHATKILQLIKKRKNLNLNKLQKFQTKANNTPPSPLVKKGSRRKSMFAMKIKTKKSKQEI